MKLSANTKKYGAIVLINLAVTSALIFAAHNFEPFEDFFNT